MGVPLQPKIYHIVHVDRLSSIIQSGELLCDAEIVSHSLSGTTIGMSNIKQRRLQLPFNSYPNLRVGDCVPFYFCPRSIMLYIIHQTNHPDLSYRGGQEQIIHLEADFHKSVQWASLNNRRWVFTLSNAGAYYFEDRNNLAQLNEIDWDAVQATNWAGCKEGKQAEFLMEQRFPWHLIERIGVHSRMILQQAVNTLSANGHRPIIELKPEWYY